MSGNGPSMTALLGLLAFAGYQNRDKIAEWLGNAGGAGQPATVPAGQGAGGGAGGASHGGFLDGMRGQDPGRFLGGALGGIIDQFKGAGHGETADSWVGTGPNKAIAPTDLEQAIGTDTLSSLQQRTGLSREEILSRLSRELPDAVDRYTPQGRLPGIAG